MNQSTDIERLVNRVFRIISVVIVLGCAYVLVSTFLVSRSTESLHVTSTAPGATLSISQPGQQATYIGKGAAHIRVKPGVYQLAASYKGKESTTVVGVLKGQPSKSVIDLSKTDVLPSVQSITFMGANNLVSNGLTSIQVAKLKRLFFNYKPAATTINITGVSPAPRDPKGASATFSLDFTATIDSKTYNAIASYADISNVQLSLADPQSGSVIFKS